MGGKIIKDPDRWWCNKKVHDLSYIWLRATKSEMGDALNPKTLEPCKKLDQKRLIGIYKIDNL